MRRNKLNDVPLQSSRPIKSRIPIRVLATARDAFPQTKATLQHIENKLEVATNSRAVLDLVMESKRPSASTTRKISRKASRSSSQKERSLRCPLRVTTLDSNVGRSGHVEFREPLVASFRGAPWSPSYKTSCQPEARCLKRKEVGSKTERLNHFTYEKSESNLHSRDFQSPSFADETVVRYLNDRPAIDALQNSEVFFKSVSEEEKAEKSRDDYSKTSQSTTTQDADLKELQLAETSTTSTSTPSAHRLDILRQHQHEAKLEKLKERIRKQLEHTEELSSRGNHLGYNDHPVPSAVAENSVTPKVRKVAAAPPAPSYKGFNPSEAKIRTPDGKVWREEEFIHLSRELCPDLELRLTEDSLAVKETPPEKTKGKRVTRPVRRIQKVAQLPSPDSKPGSTSVIGTSSWREGLRLVKMILGPAPKVGQQDKQLLSSDRAGKDKPTKSAFHSERTDTSFKLNVSVEAKSRSLERSQSKVRVENNTKKKESTLPDSKRREDRVNKDFLPVEIRGMLDDLQLDSVSQGAERMRDEEREDQKLAPSAFIRSHSPTKRKPDKLSANEEPQVTSKKRHYDTEEVRQYIVRQKEERKKRQNEEKKAQKVATEQKNKRLQELYKKQKEALAQKTKETVAPKLGTKQLQETYSKLFLEQTVLEEPLVPGQETKPGYQPSGESDKENKMQERPLSTSSSSDMSLSEAPHPLIRNNLLDPLWIQPDRLTSKAQLSSPQPSTVLNGGFVSPLLALDQIDVLQKDFVLSRRSHNTAVGSIPLTSQPVIASAVQPTINQYKSKLNRIEALKATAASLSSRIESEAKKLAGASINYSVVWNSERDSLQGDQGGGSWAKAGSPPVEEEDLFSARLQKMLGTCTPHTSFDDNLPGVGNLGEFKKLPEATSPQFAANSLPGNYRTEGMLRNLSPQQACSPGADVVDLHDYSIESISEGPLSNGLPSEEEGENPERPTLKTLEVLKEKEFCAADIAGFEHIKEVQKVAEKCLPIFRQIRSVWEELIRGSPHSVINIFAKYYQLREKGFEEWPEQAPPAQEPLLEVMSPPASIVSYEDDFISSEGSMTTADNRVTLQPSDSSPSLKEEFATRKSSYELQAVEFAHHSSGTPSAGSSNSSASSKKRMKKEKSESFSPVPSASLREESKMLPGSEYGLPQVKNALPNNGISHREEEQNPDSDSTLEELSGHSLMSLPDKIRSPRNASCPHSPSLQKTLDPAVNTAEKNKPLSNSPGPISSGPKANYAFSDTNLGANRTGAGNTGSGTMRFSPAGLQHLMSAELNYLSAIEESVRQISDVERVRGISLAQQESVSLAQILKAQQQRHERDLALLKLKAEQEALESQRQLEEAMKKAAQGHAESIQQLAQSRQEAADALQETTCKIAAQQVEAALLTTDAARQIREMTELARVQIADAVGAPATPITTLFDQERKQHSAFTKQLKSHNTSRKAESTPSQSKEEIGDSKLLSSSFDSYSESSRSKAHDQSSSSSRPESPSVSSSKGTKKLSRREKSGSSIEEQVPMAVNDSLINDTIPSIERDSASVATEYSLKFDESMTEDEIEEKSFRSLLPSESHRRINLKKRVQQDYSDEEAFPGKTTISAVKELSLPFSGGQDSFSKFTMEMVRQYMKEEEMRAAHQSSLLRLREKALKEKTRAELAWLEHQKKRLRDKGEDDKMPPIRKKQRGLLLKLQQEKAEIKRLREANKAARKERQLILKQQEEIERIRQTTMKLQEKLKSAGENKLEHCSEDDVKQTRSSTPLPTDAETWSLSSVSGSETSSIMQKLKNMRSRMDEKFLTKREQKLMERRQHAEELLQWKCRLDAEEEEIRQIEKQALAAWDKELLKAKVNRKGAGDQKSAAKEAASEEDTSVPPFSHLNSESYVPEELGSVPVESCPSKISEDQEQLESLDHKLPEEMVYKHSPSKSTTSPSKQDSTKGTHRTPGQQHSSTKSQEVSYSWSDESLYMTQSETASDQSDIESRIQALKDKLRKRKSIVYQLKKEQKKRQKERLKAKEASLIKQLETYDEFIKKTEAELSLDLEATPTAKPQIKTPSSATDKPRFKLPPLQRSETTKSWKSITDSERLRGSLESITEDVDAASQEKSVSAYTKKFIEAEIQTEEHSRTLSSFVQSTRKPGAESGDSLDSLGSSPLFKNLGELSKTSHVSQDRSEDAESCDSIVSTNRSVVQEELESVKSEESEAEVSQKVSGRADAYKVDEEQKSSTPDSLKADVCLEAEQLGKNQTERETGTPKETNKDDESALSIKSSLTLSKDLLEGDALVSEKISICKEPTYSNDFEVSSSRKEMSKDGAPLTEYCKDDFDSFTLSLEKDSRSQGEKSCYTKTPRSSIGSDDEVSECLSDKSLSVVGSVHSERLLELKSPTEFMKSKERSDVEAEPADVESSLWVSISKAEEENTLIDFNIGDRVLVSNVQPGTLRFKGPTEFAEGFWAGVELDKPEGNNNGTYNGIHYFHCKEKHGIFAPPQKISRFLESSNNFIAENSSGKQGLNHQEADQNEKKTLEEESEGRKLSTKCPQNSSSRDASAVEDSPAADDNLVFDSPFLNLLTKESSQLEAQLSVASRVVEKLIEQKEKVGLLADNFLQAFVKDTVQQLQQIGKVKNEKIQCSNQDLLSVLEKTLEANDLQSILISELEDGEEVSSPDMCPRPESPVFGASGQEELAKRLAELELSREFMGVLEDDQDWFEEDFGLSTHKLQKQTEDSAVLSEIEPPKVPSKPYEEPLLVPHTAEEVQELVHAAVEELWKCKELGHESRAFRLPRDTSDSPRDDNLEAVSEQIYKQAVFDLTREIFEEIFAEDPNLNQPIWMKPCRITSGYFRRVKDPKDLEEVKCFIATEVLRLLNLKKEVNHKTDWQKMMKFGRKKRDRVDHILAQELHEEEAQWVNYDEDELHVKMQLADGIFEALIKDTVDVLHQINEKKKLLPV